MQCYGFGLRRIGIKAELGVGPTQRWIGGLRDREARADDVVSFLGR
jgi:hypothetical protein